MTTLPTNRTVNDSPDDHVSDHNIIHSAVNDLTTNRVLTTDSRLSDVRTPADGSVATSKLASGLQVPRTKLDSSSQASLALADTALQPGSGGAPSIADNSITDVKINSSAAIAESKLALASDAAAGTASRRTLGTGATQAAAGTDSRFTDQRTPTDSSVTNAKVNASAAIAESKLALASDAAAGTASRRSLGTSATSACAGNDSRLSDTRTPSDASVVTAKLASSGSLQIPRANLDSSSRASLGLADTAVQPGTATVISSSGTIGYGSINLIDTSGGDVTVTLPAPASNKPVIRIKKITNDNNSVILTTPSGVIEFGSTTYTFAGYGTSYTLATSGTNYYFV